MMKRLSTWPGIPFQSLNISRDLDGLFSSFLGSWEQDRMPRPSVPAEYIPQIASYVDGNTICIRADLPGVDFKEVELTVKDNQLTLKGERKAEQGQQNGNRLYQEVQYGAFARTFTLPEGVTAEELQARYHNGVLEVTVPLPAAKLPKTIPIQIKGEEDQASAS
jgi:HSP20 family protein